MIGNLKLEDLSAAEEEALKLYKSNGCPKEGHGACDRLNRDLRYGLRLSEISEDLSKIVSSLDGIFARCPKLDKELMVFRGQIADGTMPLHEKDKLFRTFQFVSTTTVLEHTEPFLGSSKGVLLELHLPVGLPAYDLESLPGAGGGEAELLLPRGILWKTIDHRILGVEELPPFLSGSLQNLKCVTLEAKAWD